MIHKVVRGGQMHDPVRIHNARWLDPAGRFREGEVLLKNERIVLPPAEKVPNPRVSDCLDVPGRLLIPGLFDPHVHLRQPGEAKSEGIRNGTKAALAGGVTSLLDMPNNRPPCCNAAQLEAKRALFKKNSLVNWGLHLLAEGSFGTVPSKIAAGKVFMAGSGSSPATTDPKRLAEIFSRFPIVAVHAEDETCFLPSAAGFSHSERRPRAAIISALDKINTALTAVACLHRPVSRVVLLHVSTSDEIAWVRAMKASGWDIKAETCFHYIFFTEDDERKQGSRYKVNPPLRESEDRSAIREALLDGTIDFISTDHAPHPPEAKANRESAPSGMPGLEWAAPLLCKLAVDGLIPWGKAVDLCCRNAAEAYHLGEAGKISEGAAANLVILAPALPSDAPLPIVTRAGYNPFVEFDFPWRVETVFVNGHRAFHKGDWSPHSAGKDLYERASRT